MLRKRAWAIWRLPLPAAASSHTWRWRGVSAAAPSVGLPRALAGGHELAPGALGQQDGARRIGIGQGGAQRVTRLDAPARVRERAAQHEPGAHGLEPRR